MKKKFFVADFCLILIAMVVIFLYTGCAGTYYTQLPGRQPPVYTDSSSAKDEKVVAAAEAEAQNSADGKERIDIEAEISSVIEELMRQYAAEKDMYSVYNTQPKSGLTAMEVISQANAESVKTVTSRNQMFGVSTQYTFISGFVYDVFFNPNKATIIRLEEGEKVLNCLLGDPSMWVYETLQTTENGKNFTYILFRPFNTGIETDAHVFTDRRLYDLRLVSVEGESMVRVQFRYPLDGKAGIGNNSASFLQGDRYDSATEFSRNVEDLNYNYTIKGNASWKPVRAFSDTERTYIQFDNSFITNSETPVVYLRHNGSDELVDFTAKGVTYIVPVILSTNEVLVLKVEGQEVLIGY